VQLAERLLQGDPLREATYRQLMRLHRARGDHARALRVYHSCSAVLERELGVEPSAETRAAYEELLPAEPGLRPAASSRIAGPPLVGRAEERAQLVRAWRSADAGRAQLVLVTGEAGVGKSRLSGWTG
jgi:DNA-binding SARP family transcriptional activator